MESCCLAWMGSCAESPVGESSAQEETDRGFAWQNGVSFGKSQLNWLDQKESATRR